MPVELSRVADFAHVHKMQHQLNAEYAGDALWVIAVSAPSAAFLVRQTASELPDRNNQFQLPHRISRPNTQSYYQGEPCCGP